MVKLFKSSQEVVQEIHNAFDSAQDRLLRDAENILCTVKLHEKTDVEDKAERLEKLGFTSSLAVKEASEIREQRKEKETLLVKSRDEAELISHYKNAYPFLKFLTEEELDKICTKYNLIYAPVGNYKEDVPLKNLKEIENAQVLKEADKRGASITVVGRDEERFKEFLRSIGKKDNVFHAGEDVELLIKYNTGFNYNPYNDSDTWLFCIWDKSGRHGHYSVRTIQTTDQSGLFICAPKSHFNLEGLKKSKLGFFLTTITEVKDPIVFRYVKGGVQVLSKWGLEASDEILINSIDN